LVLWGSVMRMSSNLRGEGFFTERARMSSGEAKGKRSDLSKLAFEQK
jgi:hypothetical protein